MAWEGMLQLYQNDGSPGDAWGSYNSPYMEDNWTMQASPEMNVREPCNYCMHQIWLTIVLSYQFVLMETGSKWIQCLFKALVT